MATCLIRKISIPNKVIYLYISYTLGLQLKNFKCKFCIGNCLFGSVKLTKNADLDKCKYTGYGIGFDSCSDFLFTDGSYGKNVIIFGVDMSPSAHVDNKGKSILILGERPTQGFDDATLTEEKYPNNFIQSGKRFVLSLHYDGSKSFLFVSATKVHQFKTKNSEMKDYALCLGNVSEDFTINHIKKKNRIKRQRLI